MAEESGRRDFLKILTCATGGVGAAAFAWPLVDSMNPAQDVLALATIDVDLDQIEPGQSITVTWQGKPVFIRHRTTQEITQARESVSRIDPEPDEERVQRDEWLVVIGICTHLGCVPLGQKANQPRGEYGGWFCPCHGSQFDTSGRIRRGPAPQNLALPPYQFIADDMIRIG
ncbi:MAG: ubiquinol-cytochrome c reductase iron-sulfur subunit [Pseudomonadota bacterium]